MASALMEGLLRVINPDAYGADIVTAAVERNERYVGEYRTAARVAEDRFRVAEERLARAEAELAEAHEQASANLAAAGDWQARWNDEVHARQRAEAENANLREDLEALARRHEAAQPAECYEEVQRWDEDASRPCNGPAVAFREDKWEGGAPPYPVCAKHATPDLVPLRDALKGRS